MIGIFYEPLRMYRGGTLQAIRSQIPAQQPDRVCSGVLSDVRFAILWLRSSCGREEGTEKLLHLKLQFHSSRLGARANGIRPHTQVSKLILAHVFAFRFLMSLHSGWKLTEENWYRNQHTASVISLLCVGCQIGELPFKPACNNTVF